jgi:RNA-binding protein 5/10
VKEEEELDEFGRSVATKMKKESFRWPPCFEKSGSEFVLDPRSGMFYEALSDFFYDPKSKLYYGNKNKTYYSYNTDTKKFEQVHKLKADDATEEKGTVDAAIILPGNYSLSVLDEKTPSISIKLKTKKLSSSAKEVKKEETKVEAPVPSAPRVSKNDFMNIEKWGERQEEIRQGVQGSSGKVTTTKLGEPICLLCKRKFPNLEKLEYHVKVSNLHKENLAKKSAQEKEKKREFDTKNVYVDRAKQRRLMFSTDSSVMPVDIHSVVSLGSQSQVASRSDGETVPPVNPQESLGESNIGNMLLQKLGWKNGSAIGRHQAGGENPGGETSQQQSALKQEWDRIESMASGIQTHRNQRTLGSEKH